MSKTFEEKIHDWYDLINKIKQAPMPGLVPSPPDPRDYVVEDIPVAAIRLPDKHYLSSSPIVLNQGNTPYCGGAAAAGTANAYYNTYNLMPQGGFSMTFTYWLAKQYDGIPEIQGTYIRTVLKIMQKYGCAPESLARYSTSKITITPEALRAAEDYKIEAYARLNTMSDIQLAITKGLYIIIGTLVTSENWNRPYGFLSYPKGDLYGGHATFLFGYDSLLKRDHQGYSGGQNSWGEKWGHQGRFYLPYDYLNMKYNNMPAFLEAWGIKFIPIEKEQPEQEKPSPMPPKKKRNLNWQGRKYRGKIR